MYQQGLFQMANGLSLVEVMLSAMPLSPHAFVKDHKGIQSHHLPPPVGCPYSTSLGDCSSRDGRLAFIKEQLLSK